MQPNTLTHPSAQPVAPYQPPAPTGIAPPPMGSGTGAVSLGSGTGAVSLGSGTGASLTWSGVVAVPADATWGSVVAASADVSVVGFGTFGEFASLSSLGFVILTSVAAPSQSNTDLYRRAPMLNSPFPFPTLALPRSRFVTLRLKSSEFSTALCVDQCG